MLGLAFRFRHQFHGPPIDYAALGAAAFASWAGVPGPGEPLLIAGGVFAARHKLDLGSVLGVAFAGAVGGGVLGWVLGWKLGRTVLSGPGPFRVLRRRVIARGDQEFGRHPVLGVLLTPSWLAGVHRVHPRVYLPTNAAGALAWTLGIGLGAYFAGPPIVDLVGDLGWVTGSILVALVVAGLVAELLRRRRNAGRARVGRTGDGHRDSELAHEPETS